MELPRRNRDDVYLPDGEFRAAMGRLRERTEYHDLRIGIVYTFDFRTRMLPYWYTDKRMAPCSVRTLADVLTGAGFGHIRVVLQQWTPNFRPSRAVLDGRPLDVLLISAMQVHAEPAYDLIRDALRMGANRPLILAGGPKAIYEPTDFFELGPTPGVGADCVVTGEVYVLLALLETMFANEGPPASARAAFEAARQAGALERVPGLVYPAPRSTPRRPVAVNTGVQRLLRDLDEMPLPDAGYRLLEPPHRKRGLSPKPLSPKKVAKYSKIASVITTQGCKFNCSYCPIPAVNQRTWRHKSAERIVEEIRHLYEQFGLVDFFSTDDNFFNNRETVESLMAGLAQARTRGEPLGRRIRFYTEATEFDVYKNRDLLPLCREAGLRAIWFGIEDITAVLVNKGQTPGKTAELFGLLHALDIEPMAMMIHSDDQPLRSRRGELNGLLNQARALYRAGAVSYQCTYLAPAVGTRDFEVAASAKSIYRRVGGRPVPQAYQDGNHVVASRHPRPWSRQMNVVRAYASFYNPLNMLRVLVRPRRRLFGKRLMFQIIGQIGVVMTLPKLMRWSRQLKRGPIEVWDGLQAARIPMIDATTRHEINWAIEHLPSLGRPTVATDDAWPSKPTPLVSLLLAPSVSS